jgi:putative nucleotidyltransferase with HDIG domain
MRVGLPLMVADVVQMLINALLLAGIVRLSSGVPPRRFLVQMITNSGVAYIGYGVIGFLFLILWVPADVGPFSAILILAPLFVARWAFVQYGEEQRAHERTLSALVTAVETKDPNAAGHSARIARLAEWMAEPLSMGTQEVQALRYAAMLHDVGKIGVPTRVLRRPRPLSLVDLEALTRHSSLGVKVVRDIEFLSGCLDGIRHHHERWDGLGYPDGLAGDEIPLISRVIAVADAFDALTTDRAERPALTPTQALKQIEQRRGRQFDPHVVAALATVVDRHERPLTTATEEELEQMRGYLDHDDPIAWEQVWTAAPPSRPVIPSPEPASAGPQRHVGDQNGDETPRIPDESAVAEQVRAP